MRQHEISKDRPYLFVFGEWFNFAPNEKWEWATICFDAFLIGTNLAVYRIMNGRLIHNLALGDPEL